MAPSGEATKHARIMRDMADLAAELRPDAEVVHDMKRLASSIIGVAEAPTAAVALCLRVLGSTLATSSSTTRLRAREGLDAAGDGFGDRARLRHRVEAARGAGAGVAFEEAAAAVAGASALSAGGGARVVELLGSLARFGPRESGGASRLATVAGGFSRAAGVLDDASKPHAKIDGVAPERPPSPPRLPGRRGPPPRGTGLGVAGDETLLLRDALYALQGIEGRYVRKEPRRETYAASRDLARKLSTLDGVRELCEVGWLYERCRAFAERTDARGQCVAALRAAFADELADYYRLLAVLEAQLKGRGPAPEDAGDGSSLRRLLVWLVEPLERLKTLANVADACSAEAARGGALVSCLLQLGRHGDGDVAALVGTLSAKAAAPILAATRRWIGSGQLLPDAACEFFVAEAPRDDGADEVLAGSDFWRERYVLRRAVIPSFVTAETAEKILVVGKSINFLRRCCGDDGPMLAGAGVDGKVWAEAFRAAPAADAEDRGALADVVAAAYDRVNRRLLSSLTETFGLLDHLLALRCCVLLTQGDFAGRLVGEVARLGRNGPSAFGGSRDAVAAFEAALRSSNAERLAPAALERLRVDVVDADGDTGVGFGLSYDATPPLDAVLDPAALAAYGTAHRALARRKRVELLLSGCWWSLVTASKRGRKSLSGRARKALHDAGLKRHEMAALCATVAAHCADEFGAAWAGLVAAVRSAKNLDDVRGAHERYLDAVFADVLLLPRAGGDSALGGGAVAAHLDATLDAAARFCALVDAYVADALAGSATAEGLAGRLRDAIASYDAAAGRFTRLLAVAANDEPTATKLAFRLQVDVQEVRKLRDLDLAPA